MTMSTMVDGSCVIEHPASEEKTLETVSSTDVIASQLSTNVVASSNNSGTALVESSSLPEQEEGEIDDDDLEYENISSEEEFNIRERIAQLEAMDTELGLLNGINESDPAARYMAYKSTSRAPRKENYEAISDEEDVELYLQRYEPLPKPKLLPARRRPRPIRSKLRVLDASSIRRHGRSRRKPIKRKHESSIRKSTISRRHKRRRQHNVSTINLTDSSDSEADFPLDRNRLLAACNMSPKKRKTDKENWDALKQKLKLSLERRKKEKEKSTDVELVIDESIMVEDEEDEEVLQLRLQALKTKPEVKDSDVISLLDEPPTPEKIAEEHELRMIALKSTFTNKAQIRHKKTLEERPYSPSDEIPLLSPVHGFPEFLEDYDDDVQIIETRPETVEIMDSSSDDENRMEISPPVSPQCPEPPNIYPIDMELASSGESCSPVQNVQQNEHSAKESSPELEAPPPPIISNIQSESADEDDEETLRNQLLSTLSCTAVKPNAAPIENRPATPDSIGEEEAEALRELLLAKMNTKRDTKKAEQKQTPPQASEIPSKTDFDCIPNENEKLSSSVPCIMEPLSINVTDNFEPAIVNQITSTALDTEMQASVSASLPRVHKNSNLITLIGKQKINRKKRKKSVTASQAKNLVVTTSVPASSSRVLIKAHVNKNLLSAQVPRINPRVPLTTTTKLVNNPNKLINLNTPLVPSPREKSAVVDSYVQKIVPKLIIQVGNSDSDSDPNYYPSPDSEPDEIDQDIRQTFLRDLDNASPSRVMLESPTYSPLPSAPMETENDQSPAESNPQAPVSGVPSGEVPAVNNTANSEVAFEKRLDQFLKTVRSQIDRTQQIKQVSSGSPTGSSLTGFGVAKKIGRRPTTTQVATPITPSAVRHLPKSAQIEYKRLVTRMAQLEKAKQVGQAQLTRRKSVTLTKTIINNGPGRPDLNKNHAIVVTVNQDRRDVVDNSVPPSVHDIQVRKSPVHAVIRETDPLFKRVLINNTVAAESRNNLAPEKGSCPVQTTVKDINQPRANSPASLITEKKSKDAENVQPDPEIYSLREALSRLSTAREEERHNLLVTAEQRSENHSRMFLQELQDLIYTLKKAQEKRRKQYDLENKVAFLREKLAFLEQAAAAHQKSIATVFPALQESHGRVMNSRKKSNELNELCLAIGREVKGQPYDLPSDLRGEIHEQLKLLTVETKRLKNMKKLTLDEFKELTAEQRRQQLKKQLEQHQQTVCQISPAENVSENDARPSSVSSTRSDSVNSEMQLLTGSAGGESKQYARSAPASRTASPLVPTGIEQSVVAQEAPAILSTEKRSHLAKYTSPLVSLKDQSALNIPDGVICPYQMRGECIDQECTFEHFN